VKILIFQNTGAKPKKTMVESLLGEHSNLVNLDNIVQVPLYVHIYPVCLDALKANLLFHFDTIPILDHRFCSEAESKKKHGVWDPMPKLTVTSPYVHSRFQPYARVAFIPQSRTWDLASVLKSLARFNPSLFAFKKQKSMLL
jgi:hypothetical protein